MRHRIKAGKVGSFAPEKQKVEMEQQENRDVADEVEEIFEDHDQLSLPIVWSSPKRQSPAPSAKIVRFK